MMCVRRPLIFAIWLSALAIPAEAQLPRCAQGETIVTAPSGAWICGKPWISTGLQVVALTTPAAPSVTPKGRLGGTTYGYRVTALTPVGETAASIETTNTFGNATLSAIDFNTITWAPVPNATGYNVYRTQGGVAPPKLIATTGSATTTTNDTGQAGSAVTPPTVNTTGALTLQNDGVGTSTTVGAGFTLQNTTPATAIAQQYSPPLMQAGQGWADVAGDSMEVKAGWVVETLAGTVEPGFHYALVADVNGAGFVERVYYDYETASWNAFAFAATSNAASVGFVRAPNNNPIAARNVGNDADAFLIMIDNFDLTRVSAANIPITQDSTRRIATAALGVLVVVNLTDTEVCQFSVIGAGAVVELTDSGGNCSATVDNAATLNVYYKAAPSAGIYIQNKKVGTKTIRVILHG